MPQPNRPPTAVQTPSSSASLSLRVLWSCWPFSSWQPCSAEAAGKAAFYNEEGRKEEGPLPFLAHLAMSPARPPACLPARPPVSLSLSAAFLFLPFSTALGDIGRQPRSPLLLSAPPPLPSSSSPTVASVTKRRRKNRPMRARGIVASLQCHCRRRPRCRCLRPPPPPQQQQQATAGDSRDGGGEGRARRRGREAEGGREGGPGERALVEAAAMPFST